MYRAVRTFIDKYNNCSACRSQREPVIEPRNQMSARATKDPASPTMHGLLRRRCKERARYHTPRPKRRKT
eukprot:1112013-Heterocapsa_arctica.AAC.1